MDAFEETEGQDEVEDHQSVDSLEKGERTCQLCLEKKCEIMCHVIGNFLPRKQDLKRQSLSRKIIKKRFENTASHETRGWIQPWFIVNFSVAD